MVKSKDEKQPHIVVTDAGTFHSEYATESAAQAASKQANAQAEELGIKTRYTAQAR